MTPFGGEEIESGHGTTYVHNILTSKQTGHIIRNGKNYLNGLLFCTIVEKDKDLRSEGTKSHAYLIMRAHQVDLEDIL